MSAGQHQSRDSCVNLACPFKGALASTPSRGRSQAPLSTVALASAPVEVRLPAPLQGPFLPPSRAKCSYASQSCNPDAGPAATSTSHRPHRHSEDSGQWARWESAKLSWLRNVLQSGVPWGQSSGLWAHCRFHLMSVKLWTVHIGQWAHCRGHSRQRAWPRFRARRVTAIAKPPIPVIIIATRGALPIVAWAMAPVAAVTPMPVTVPALMALPIPCLQSLRLSAIAARTGAMERLPEVEVAACLTCPSQTAPCRGSGWFLAAVADQNNCRWLLSSKPPGDSAECIT